MAMSFRKQAIAVEYGKNTTPVVTANAELTEHLIAEACRQGIYVTEDPQLVALLSRVNVDQEIPPELFTAVAVILSWVYWLKGMRPGDQKRELGSFVLQVCHSSGSLSVSSHSAFIARLI
jgi:flagellar biosynthesis protein